MLSVSPDNVQASVSFDCRVRLYFIVLYCFGISCNRYFLVHYIKVVMLTKANVWLVGCCVVIGWLVVQVPTSQQKEGVYDVPKRHPVSPALCACVPFGAMVLPVHILCRGFGSVLCCAVALWECGWSRCVCELEWVGFPLCLVLVACSVVAGVCVHCMQCGALVMHGWRWSAGERTNMHGLTILERRDW